MNLEEVKLRIVNYEVYLEGIISLFGIEYLPLKSLKLDPSESKQLTLECLQNQWSNPFLSNWNKFKESVLEFSYFPFVINNSGDIIAGRHRFDFLKKSAFDQETLIPCIRVKEESIPERLIVIPAKVGDASHEGGNLSDKETEVNAWFSTIEVRNYGNLLQAFYLACRRMNYYLYKYYELTGTMYPARLVSYKKSIKQGETHEHNKLDI